MPIEDKDKNCVFEEVFGVEICGTDRTDAAPFDIVLIHLCAKVERYNDRCFLLELALKKIAKETTF